VPLLLVSLFVYGAGTATNLQARYAGTDLATPSTRGRAISVALVSTTAGAVAGPNLVDPLGDLAVELGLPLVIAARPGLGTINHTLLTIEAARAVGLDVAAVVMTPWPDEPDEMVRSNRETIERFASVNVLGLPPTDPGSRAAAAAALPLDEGMGASGPGRG